MRTAVDRLHSVVVRNRRTNRLFDAGIFVFFVRADRFFPADRSEAPRPKERQIFGQLARPAERARAVAFVALKAEPTANAFPNAL